MQTVQPITYMYLQDMLDLTYQTDYAYDIDNADNADNDLQKKL